MDNLFDANSAHRIFEKRNLLQMRKNEILCKLGEHRKHSSGNDKIEETMDEESRAQFK